MNPVDQDRARRLLAVLLARDASTQEDCDLIEACDSLKAFRVRLLTKGGVGSAGAELVDRWRQEIRRRIDNPDSSELMHALEKLVQRQQAIDLGLARIDATLLRELQLLDASCGQLAALRDKLQHTRASIVRCRASIMQNLPLLAVES